MAKILIYSKGQVFQKCVEQITWKFVVAIVDKSAKEEEMLHGVPVILPANIGAYKYDYIAICSNIHFEEIMRELVIYRKVPICKIVSWRIFFPEENRWGGLINNVVSVMCQKWSPRKVLNVENGFLNKYILQREELGVSIDSKFDCFSDEEKRDRLYDVCYCNEQLFYEEDYDLIIIWGKNTIKKISKLHGFRKALFVTPYVYDLDLWSGLENVLDRYECRTHMSAWGIAVELEEKKINLETPKNKSKIYVVTHREYPVVADEIYTPICVGGNYYEKGFLKDSEGDNIAHLNEKINECTALYWIWKNTHSSIVGLNHYRRYFTRGFLQSSGDVLHEKEIQTIMNQFDLIMPLAECFQETVYGQLISSVPDQKLCKEGIQILKKVMRDKQPEYMEALNNVFEKHNFYRCNMFITKREILNAYCSWLFSFLIDVAEQVNVSNTDDYSKRIVGFLAERMWTVWLENNPQKIKLMPYVIL